LREQYGHIEKQLLQKQKVIAGVDEVGRGALAGPVYAGAVVLDYHKLMALTKEERSLIRDSKALNRAQREKSLPLVMNISLSYATGSAETEEIEQIGITKATFLAMHRALSKLKCLFDILLIDGKFPLPDFALKQFSLIGGDRTCYSIAAASILAKETRDKIMIDHANSFPHYGFESHVGYATKKHLHAIHTHGVCTLHRKNFEPIRSLCIP
jgi:ribonuclease HII